MDSLETSNDNLRVNKARQLLAGLTRRQRDVVALIACGLSVRQIAVILKLSSKTVEKHRHRAGLALPHSDIPFLTTMVSQAGVLPAFDDCCRLARATIGRKTLKVVRELVSQQS